MYDQTGPGDAAMQMRMQMQQQKTAYDRAQSALGGPVVETLQVDESINSLAEVAEFHIETVRALLRRLQPVTGDLGGACGLADPVPKPCKVPLSYRIDNRRDELHALTAEVQAAIRALQI